MKKPDDPEIVHVDQIDNAAIVTFKDEPDVVYPAILLHAAKGVADAMHQKDLEEEGKQTDKPPTTSFN